MGVREKMIAVMEGLELSSEWRCFEKACGDQFRDTNWDWSCSPWGRMINGKRVFVVLSYEGNTHNTWRLFVDGSHVRDMLEINIQMGSGADAQRIAEEEIR